ncbi:S24 family peptidase [Bradyrhizobium quebecense]
MTRKSVRSTEKQAVDSSTVDISVDREGQRAIRQAAVVDSGGDAPAFHLPDGRKMSIGERFQFALRVLPVDARADLGRNEKTLRTWKTADDMSLNVLIALAAKTGIPISWIVEGTLSIGTTRELVEEFSFVPKLLVEASAGAGALSQDVAFDADIVAFRSDWLRKLGINPRYARAMFARGDGMWPTINDGDLLLVDESITSVVDDGIYIIVSHGAVRVKRLQMRRDGSLLLKSDNTAYEAEVVPPPEINDVRVAARVRWYGRSI